MFSRNLTAGSKTVTVTNGNFNKVIIRNNQGRGILVNKNSQAYRNYLARQANIKKLQNKSNNTSKNIKNTTLLKNFSRGYLQSCFLNTYTTLAYLTGQSTISDAVLFRYIISFETLLSKINGNLTTNREKIFENLWNKTRGYENSNKFSTITDIEQHLRYYKTIMKNGFKSPGNSRLAALSRNLN